jgi:hypothetical protein
MLRQLRRAALAALSIAIEGVFSETRPVRAGILSAVCILALAVPATAQDWAKKLFTVTAHDFGTVANGAKTEFRFPIKNVFVEDLHISQIRSSCQCTTPTLVMKGESKAPEGGGLTLKTYEQGEVLAQFNTHIMTGYKRATLTLTIDKPYHAEVQLTVQGNIITDIQVTPTHIDLSNVSQGQAVEKTITLTRTGRRDWKIMDIRCANTNFEVEPLEKSRTLSSVTYELKVKLRDTAPAGAINDQLVLVTNDDRLPQFPIQVQGEVRPELSITPNLWMAGSLAPGDAVKKTLIIRNNTGKPFKIVNIVSDDPAIQFKPIDPAAPAKPLHVLPITLTATDNPGRQVKLLRIETDLGTTLMPELSVQYLVKGTPKNVTGTPPSTGVQPTGNSSATTKQPEINVAKPLTIGTPASTSTVLVPKK